MAKRKDPLVPLNMRLPKSLIERLDKTAAAAGSRTTRTAITKRLIGDGFKWWEREDLEQDTTVGIIHQMNERVATILAMQNIMAESMGLFDVEEGSERFEDRVRRMKRQILNERKRGNGPVGPSVGLGDSRDGNVDDGPSVREG